MIERRSVCVLSWILAAVLAASAPAPAFGDDAAAKLRKTLDDGKAMLRAYLAAIDPAEFDLKRKAAELGKDPGEIFAFVRDEIGYEPYAGALRGAEGCLRAGAAQVLFRRLGGSVGRGLHEGTSGQPGYRLRQRGQRHGRVDPRQQRRRQPSRASGPGCLLFLLRWYWVVRPGGRGRH